MWLYLSAAIDFECLPPDYPIPSSLVIGTGNIGSTMDNDAGGTVWANRIQKKVECLYLRAQNGVIDDPAIQQMIKDNTDTYIRHTACSRTLPQFTSEIFKFRRPY